MSLKNLQKVMQKMQAFNRERAPERVVHAKWGAANSIPPIADSVASMQPDPTVTAARDSAAAGAL